jgi:hypothetical protein
MSIHTIIQTFILEINPRPLRTGSEGRETDRPGNPGHPDEAGCAREECHAGEKRSGAVPVAP